MSRMVASPCTIGGMADDIVIPAKAATQIQVSTRVIRWKTALLTTSAGWSAVANSRTNGLPTKTPPRATRKMPTLLSGCSQRSMKPRLTVKVRIVSARNVATAPISKVIPGALRTRPITRPATATASATSTAVSNGTLPTRTQ